MIEKLAIVAADIDGTLCPKGQDLMPKTKAAIERLHKEGVLFGPASGRPLDHRTLDNAKKWGLSFPFDFAIGMNGGELYDLTEDRYERYYQLKKEDVREIVSFVKDFDVNIIVYVNGYDEIVAYRMDQFMIESQKRNNSIVTIGGVDELSAHDTGKIEVHLKPEEMDRFMEAVKAHENPNWIAVKTFVGFGHITIEFMDPHIQKGLGLQKLCEKRNIPLDQVMAFGDMENDIGLLKEAGWGVCLLNGADDTKAVAQDITEFTVEEDGVGNYLEKNWFKEPLV